MRGAGAASADRSKVGERGAATGGTDGAATANASLAASSSAKGEGRLGARCSERRGRRSRHRRPGHKRISLDGKITEIERISIMRHRCSRHGGGRSGNGVAPLKILVSKEVVDRIRLRGGDMRMIDTRHRLDRHICGYRRIDPGRRLRGEIGERQTQLGLRLGLNRMAHLVPLDLVRLGDGQFQLVGKINRKGRFVTDFRLEGRLDACRLHRSDWLDDRLGIEHILQLLELGSRGNRALDGNRFRAPRRGERRIINFELAKKLVLEIEMRFLRSGGTRRRWIARGGRLEADDPGKLRQRIIVGETVAPQSTAECGLLLYHT